MIVSISTVHSHRLCYYVSSIIWCFQYIPHAFYDVYTRKPWQTCQQLTQGMEDDRQSMGDLSSQLAEALDHSISKHYFLLTALYVADWFWTTWEEFQEIIQTWDLLYRFCWKQETCECGYWWWFTVLHCRCTYVPCVAKVTGAVKAAEAELQRAEETLERLQVHPKRLMHFIL